MEASGPSAVAAPARFESYRYVDVGPTRQLHAPSRWVAQGLTTLDENTLIISCYDRERPLSIDRASSPVPGGCS